MPNSLKKSSQEEFTSSEKQSRGSDRRFTLIELMVTISIIAILAIVVLASFTQIRKSSRDAQRKSDLQSVAEALQRFYNDNASFPLSGSGNISYYLGNCTSVGSLVNAKWGSGALAVNERRGIVCGGLTYIKNLPAETLASTPQYCYQNVGVSTQRFELFARLETPPPGGATYTCNSIGTYNYRITSRD